MKTNFVEEPLPKYHTAVRDLLSNVYFLVYSERTLTFEEAKRHIVKFMAVRVRKLPGGSRAAHETLPSLVALIVQKGGQVIAPHLSLPDKFVDRREVAKKLRKK